MTNCVLCGIRIMGKPVDTSEGPMCPDATGCRRRALKILQARPCDSFVGSRGTRCELPNGHEGAHKFSTTTWT